MKICKTLDKKAKLANADLQLALLNHQNTPIKPTNLSGQQRQAQYYNCTAKQQSHLVQCKGQHYQHNRRLLQRARNIMLGQNDTDWGKSDSEEEEIEGNTEQTEPPT